jgi:uncharacterized protein (TIGR02145 family)
MKNYNLRIVAIIFFVMGITSCSNEETKTQNTIVTRPTVPIQAPTVTDIDGNVYRIVTINNQNWTKTNLNVSHYRNGDPIPHVRNGVQWINLTTGAWCYYNGDAANGVKYGKLYNWYAVNDPRGLVPNGWHVPSNEEWTNVSNYLGGYNVAGGKMKATGTSQAGTGLWWSPNANATNSIGFTGQPGGVRRDNGAFNNIASNGFWWSTTESTLTPYGCNFSLSFVNSTTYVTIGTAKTCGLSVRCIKD